MPHFSLTPMTIAFYLFWVVLFFLLFRISITSNYSKKLWLYAKRIVDEPTEKNVRILNEHLESRPQSYKNEKSRIVNDACKSVFASQKVSPERKATMLALLKEKGFLLEDFTASSGAPISSSMPEVLETPTVSEDIEKQENDNESTEHNETPDSHKE